MSERLILANANIITMDYEDSRAQSLAMEDSRVIRVGLNKEFRDLKDEGWPVLDLAGKTVLPGFTDCHNHLMLTGLLTTGVDMSGTENIDQVLERLADRAGGADRETWIRGGNLNELGLAEERMPDRRELDRAVPDHPVFLLHQTCHVCAFNTRALDLVSLPEGLPGVDLENGRPTGVVRDPGILTFVHPKMAALIPDEARLAAIDAAAGQAMRRGITTVHALEGGDLGPGDTKFLHLHQDRVPLRMVCFNQSMDLAEVRELGLPRVGGCICSDGAFEAHTAALFEPYADDPDNYGALTYTQEEMDAFVLEAHRAGLQVAVHCESDRAIEQVLWAMEKAMRDTPRGNPRHRIEHLELPTHNQLTRMAEVGIIASMQPAFFPAFIGQERMETYEKLLGEARLRQVHPYRSILSQGIRICGGSDSPVTPYHPLAGIQAAVNHPNEGERVTRREALQMFTTDAAYSGFEELEKGTIAPGKLADLVVLADDPTLVPQDRIASIEVEMVFIGGEKFDESRPF